MRSACSTFVAALVSAAALLAPSSARGVTVYAVDLDNDLLAFDSATPGVIDFGTPITGLQANEVIRSIDFRPSTGQLYAIGSSSRLYTLNTSTGAATQVGGVLSTLLSGTAFGMDFNPLTDQIRVVSDADQNLRLNPNTGAIASVDPSLSYIAPNLALDPNIVSIAYRVDTGGATATLLGFDTVSNFIVNGNPIDGNAGTMQVDLPLSVIASNFGGLDILGVGLSAVGYTSLQPETSSVSTFYTVNFNTGALTPVGVIGGGDVIRAISVVVPEPASLTLLGLGALSLLSRRRSR
jgi:hypothetical protein